MTNCEYCGDPLVDGGIDWYCPKKDCHDKELGKIFLAFRERKQQEERKEYERLKAKYETIHRST